MAEGLEVESSLVLFAFLTRIPAKDNHGLLVAEVSALVFVLDIVIEIEGDVNDVAIARMSVIISVVLGRFCK